MDDMTSDVDLKKQSQMGMEPELDVEAGLRGLLNPKVQENLCQFYHDVSEITLNLFELQRLNEEATSTHSSKILRGLRNRMESDMAAAVLEKVRVVKARLESLDQSNVISRKVSVDYREGSTEDRTRMSITAGLPVKLRNLMCGFQSLSENILVDHKEYLKRRYYGAVGEMPTEEDLEKMISGSGKVAMFEGKSDTVRHEAVMDIQRSLTKLHQVFLDMAVLVEAQGELTDSIEENVAIGGQYISGGTNTLHYAKQMKKKENDNKWVLWLCAVVVIIFLVGVAWSTDWKSLAWSMFDNANMKAVVKNTQERVRFPRAPMVSNYVERSFLWGIFLYLLAASAVGLYWWKPKKAEVEVQHVDQPVGILSRIGQYLRCRLWPTLDEAQNTSDRAHTSEEVIGMMAKVKKNVRRAVYAWRVSLFSDSDLVEEVRKLARKYWFIWHLLRVIFICSWGYMVIGSVLFLLIKPVVAVSFPAAAKFIPPNRLSDVSTVIFLLSEIISKSPGFYN